MTGMDVYGAIVTGGDARNAVRDTIKRWIPSYLAEVGAQHGRDRTALKPFRSYRSSPRGFQHWPEDQLPACILVSPGPTPGSIERHGLQYSAEWPVGVGVLVSAKDQDSTNDLLEIYVAAVRALLLQHGSLGGVVTETRWIDEDYTDLTYDDSRTLAGGTVNIGVRVDAVLDSGAGLAAPPADPIAIPADPVVVVATGTTTTATPPVFKSDQEIDV